MMIFAGFAAACLFWAFRHYRPASAFGKSPTTVGSKACAERPCSRGDPAPGTCYRQTAARCRLAGRMKIGLAQLNTTVGDLRGNQPQNPRRLPRTRGARRGTRPHAGTRDHRLPAAGSRLQVALRSAESRDARRTAPRGRRRAAARRLRRRERRRRASPFTTPPRCSSAASRVRKFHKSLLPTYDVFDEDRYFEPATSRRAGRDRRREVRRHHLRGHLDGRISAAPPLRRLPRSMSLVAQGAEIIVNLSASPFTLGKAARRVRDARRARRAAPRADRLLQRRRRQRPAHLRRQLARHRRRWRRCKRSSQPFAEDLAVIDTERAARRSHSEFQSEPEELFHALVPRHARLPAQVRLQIRRARPQRRHRQRGHRGARRARARRGKRPRRHHAHAIFLAGQHRRFARRSPRTSASAVSQIPIQRSLRVVPRTIPRDLRRRCRKTRPRKTCSPACAA